MKKKLLPLFMTVLLLVAFTSCGSSNSTSGYDSGYEDGYEEGYAAAEEAYQDGYNEGIAELESYKENNMIVPYLLEELISEGKYDTVTGILTSDIYLDLLIGEYVGDRSTMLLHKSSCEDIYHISFDDMVFYADNKYSALDVGFTSHDCIKSIYDEVWGN